MIKNFSFPQRNRQFVFEPKKPYDLAAACGGEMRSNYLQNTAPEENCSEVGENKPNS